MYRATARIPSTSYVSTRPRRESASIVTAASRTTAVTMNFDAAVYPLRPMPLSIAAITIPPSTPWIAFPAAAEQARASDHRGRDRVENECATVDRRRDRPQPRRVDDARDARREAAKHERDRSDRRQTDAGPARSLGVPADRVEVAPELRPAEQDRPNDEHADDEEHDPGHAPDRRKDAAVVVTEQDEGDPTCQSAANFEQRDRRRWSDEPGLTALRVAPPERQAEDRDEHEHEDPARERA